MTNRHVKILDKCQAKLQQGTTSHWSEWPSLISLHITNAGGGVEKREPPYTVGGNVNWYNHHGEQYGGTFRKLNTEIPLLGLHLDKTFIKKDTCSPMFIAAPFTIAETGKRPKHPSADEWIKKMWYRSSRRGGSEVTNPTSIHEDVGSIPGLIHGLRIWHCCGCGVSRQL